MTEKYVPKHFLLVCVGFVYLHNEKLSQKSAESEILSRFLKSYLHTGGLQRGMKLIFLPF